MEKGINLALTKSLFDFVPLLERAIEAVSTEKRSVIVKLPNPFEKIFSTKQDEAYMLFDSVQSYYKLGIDVHIHNGDKKNGGDASTPPTPTLESILSYYSESYEFWVGVVWEENGKHDPCIWVEFDADNCSKKHWDTVYELIGTSGKYYSKAHFKFKQEFKKAVVRFYLKDEYLRQFYDENADLNYQKEILTGFISEVLDKI